MSDITNKAIVLKLNSVWQVVGYSTIAKAIIDLVGGVSVKALDIQYVLDDEGTPDFSVMPAFNLVNWDEWIKLPIHPWHLVIHSQKLTIRAPTIVVSQSFSKMPMKEWKGKPSNSAIYIRDGGIDQYTGKKLDRKKATTDHVIPRSRGGGDDWTNLVTTDKELNSKKGNSLNSEIGLKLIKLPKKPRPIPISHLIKEIRHVDWKLFITE